MSLSTVYAVKKDLTEKFGPTSLLKNGDRALLWRIFLGVIPSTSLKVDADLVDHVSDTLSKLTADYTALKAKSLPTMDKVVADPLGAGDGNGGVDSSGGANDEWSAYHTSLATMEDIKMDLDRLYITGIVDEYFEKPHRIALLSNVLLLWACRNKEIAYRQGMHEVAACLLYAVEEELLAYNSASSENVMRFPKSKILAAISEPDAVEAHTYWLFDHLMLHLSPLYDPEAKKKGSETNTNVVHFCCAIQQQVLQEIDPDLYLQLENCSVYPQIYGMRWTRLMFSREMPMVSTHGLRVWDYLLAQCFRVKALEGVDDDGSLFSDVNISSDDSTNVFSEYLSSVSNSNAENSIFPSTSGRAASISVEDKKRYGYKSTVLVYVGHVAMSMIEHVREQCLSGSMNEALSALMRYPTLNEAEVVEILQRANSIANDTFVIDSSRRPAPDTDDTTTMHAGGKANSKVANNASRPTWLAAPQNNTHLKSSGYTNSSSKTPTINNDSSTKLIGSSEASEKNLSTKISNIPAKASQIAVKGMQTMSRGIDKLRGSIITAVRGTKAKEEDTTTSSHSSDSFTSQSLKSRVENTSSTSTLTEDGTEQKEETRVNAFDAKARKHIDDEDIFKDTSSASANVELVDDLLGSIDSSFRAGTRNNIFRSGTRTEKVPPSDDRASTSGIAARISDITDGMKALGKKSSKGEQGNQIVKSRADAAKKLRQLAEFLEGPEMGLMQEYDQQAYGTKKVDGKDSDSKSNKGVGEKATLANDDLFSLLLEK